MPSEELNLLDKEVILRILGETTKSEDKNRRRQSFNAYQVYSGNQRVYVEEQLRCHRPISWKSYTLSNISLSKMVIDKRAQAYNEPPIRSVGGNETKTMKLDDIYEQANGLRELQFFDTIFNLNKYCLMWVNYRQKEKQFQFISMHPYEFVIVRDKDTGRLLVVGLNYPDVEITQDAKPSGEGGGLGNNSGDGIPDLIAESQTDSAATGNTWVFWSDTQHVKVRRTAVPTLVNGIEEMKPSVDYIQIPGNPNMVNPIGKLPFVLATIDTAIDYPTVNPITEQSITFNVQQSETLTAKNIHGSGIQVFKYPEKFQGRFKQMTHGQTEAVHLPQSKNPEDKATEFDYKTSGAQLGPMMDIDMNYLQQVLHEHGLENVNMEQGKIDMSSGVSKAISGASVQKVIEKNQQIYAKLERDMFEVIKAWDESLGLRMFNRDDELAVIYQKPKVMVSDRETLDNLKLMLELGVIEEWEKFIKMDPNLSEEEARDKLERVEKAKKEKAEQFLGRGMNGNIQGRIGQEGQTQPQGLNGSREEES